MLKGKKDDLNTPLHCPQWHSSISASIWVQSKTSRRLWSTRVLWNKWKKKYTENSWNTDFQRSFLGKLMWRKLGLACVFRKIYLLSFIFWQYFEIFFQRKSLHGTFLLSVGWNTPGIKLVREGVPRWIFPQGEACHYQLIVETC